MMQWSHTTLIHNIEVNVNFKLSIFTCMMHWSLATLINNIEVNAN